MSEWQKVHFKLDTGSDVTAIKFPNNTFKTLGVNSWIAHSKCYLDQPLDVMGHVVVKITLIQECRLTKTHSCCVR